MAFTPLTQQQYQSARNAGFSPDAIVQMEQKRKATSTPSITPARQADIETAQKYGAIATPNTERPSMIGEGLKTAANVPSSAWNFVKGAFDIVNPISTVNRIKQAVGEFKGLAEDVGGYGKAASMFGKALPRTAYEMFVPEATRGLIQAGKGFATGQAIEEKAGLETAQRVIVSDPVGQIAPFLIAGRAVAGKAGVGAQFDTAVSKVAQPIIKSITATTKAVKSTIGGTTRFGIGQATGLQPETITQIAETPKQFTRAARAGVDRISLGQEVQSSLSRRSSALAETGEAYAPVRESVVPVKVSGSWLDSTIKDLTGLDIQKGQIKTTGAAKLREASDVRAVQHLYTLWKPIFQKGSLTANEFLNFRTDLAKLSRFERQIGKSQPVESFAKLARGRFNESFRPQLEGLEAIDVEFSKQTGELGKLSKGLVDKNGHLTEAAINRIANATGKGKDLLLDRLEETVPGITQKIKVLKAVEDIQNASGIKVGTYARGAAIGGGFLLGGPLQGIVTAILTSPEVAVPLLRQYGLLKNSAAVQTVVRALKSGGSTVNQLPNQLPAIFNKEVKTTFGK